jgi:hypothetical protein
MIYQMISDPGHGWLRVPVAELVELGIADQISEYSYREGDDAWLEEDCDMARFVYAMVDNDRERVPAWWALNVREQDVNSTHIRNLPSYSKK